MTGALKGIRILDLTRVWSGPLAGRILADLGAEVIQVSGRVTVPRADYPPEVAKILAVFPDNEPGERPWNRTSANNDFHRNKLGITLELNTPEGVELFKRFVKISDVVLENYSPRVMPNFGLDYPSLSQINPAIILCSMPGYGSTGPYRDWVSYGTNLDPASGLASLMGYPGEEAHMSGNAYPDPIAALHAAGAILTALFHQRRTGKGQFIDLSQAESATSLIGEAVLGYTLNGKIPPRLGNRHPSQAPHGCYKCEGEDKWVAIAVSTDEEWAALCHVMESPELIDDQRFADSAGRCENQDAIDERIEAWTSQRPHHEAMRLLQEAGVPAGAVLDAAELFANEHLSERDFFWEIDHPEVGLRKYVALPMKFSKTPVQKKKPAPCLGEHNEYVFSEILGLSKDEIAELEQKGIIGDQPID
ncbi:MAG: CoA transferase [Deltaproteobacteria bacterium]|nr:CoA transferase [Deltaproteobacteria bacterium]MBW2322836.1 CoA transferase [Deltaproteobacteria bacterium]